MNGNHDSNDDHLHPSPVPNSMSRAEDDGDDLVDDLLEATACLEESPSDGDDMDSEIRAAFDPQGSPTLAERARDLAPPEDRDQVQQLGLRAQMHPDDPAWSILLAHGLAVRWQRQVVQEIRVARATEIQALQAASNHLREEVAAKVAETLAEAQQELAKASAREVAALETSARTAIGQVVEDLRQQTHRALEEVRRASPAHRTIWQRIWPALLSLTTAIGVGVGVGAGVYIWAAPPANALLVQTRDGQVWWAPQGQEPLPAHDDPTRRYIEIHPAQITAPRRTAR